MYVREEDLARATFDLIYYRIAGNIRGMQIFVDFADRPATTKIKTTKILTRLPTS